MVLWALLLLALLAGIFGANARTEVYLARNLVENAQAEALADAGIYRAIAGLAMDPQDGGFLADGRVYTWRASGGDVRFLIRDEGGKVDLNQAPAILLGELFIVIGVDPKLSMELADAIVDFRDEDDEKGRNGAERRDYESAGLSHGPKNEPFQLVDELVYVLGITPNIYRRVAPFLTVRGQEEKPHLYTAAPEVRAAMIAAQAARTRTGRASGRGTGRTSRNEGAGMTEDALGDLGGADAGADLAAVTRSGVPVFTVHAEGRIPSGAVFAREAMVDLAGGENLPFVIRAWRQTDRILFPLTEIAETAR